MAFSSARSSPALIGQDPPAPPSHLTSPHHHALLQTVPRLFAISARAVPAVIARVLLLAIGKQMRLSALPMLCIIMPLLWRARLPPPDMGLHVGVAVSDH